MDRVDTKEELEIGNEPEGTSSQQLANSQPQPQTQPSKMEVHKHPHHVTHQKKWGEYFLEFLMIFLAVTLGFFAENIRERATESHREKQFAQQLYSELREDSIVVAQKISERRRKEKAMDYVAIYLKDSSLEDLPEQFYPALTMDLYLINRFAFEPKDGILSQLRNSGSLRFFKSVYLQKLLGDINVSINNIRNRNEQEYQYFANPIKPFMLKYYDFSWLNELRSINDTSPIHELVYDYNKFNFHVKGRLMNLSSLDRDEASNMVLFYKQMVVSTRTLQLNDYVKINHKILEALRANYKLRNE
ncbi:MAG: hypothetical protein E6H10_16925 [Bacteroidetes bacterium]|nr:MAG: hypothetical protein E6H10_16925 [Bacteroidota bacterium]